MCPVMFRDLKASSTVRASTVLAGATCGTAAETAGVGDLAGLDLLVAPPDGVRSAVSEVQADVESSSRARSDGSTCLRRVIMLVSQSLVVTSSLAFRSKGQDARH